MSESLQRERIEAILDQLVERLDGDWLLIGGALAAVWLEPRRVTEDLDIIGIDQVQGRNTLMNFALDLGLPIETVNSAADFFVSRIPDWREQLEVFRVGTKGTIYRPNPTLFLLLKIGRLSEQDWDDCVALLAVASRDSLQVDVERVTRALGRLDATNDAALGMRRASLMNAIQNAP